MRRTEKQINDQQRIDDIIRGSLVCRVALAKENQPYLVPMSFGYDGAALYLHTAIAGKKIDCFEANPRVCFEFERRVELRKDPQSACRWSFRFESVIGYGTISELLEPAEKAQALNEIMKQYSGMSWSFEGESLAAVRVWKVTISSMTGKQSLPKERNEG